MKTLLLIVDGIALVGLVIFSVLAAVERETSAYLVGQIVCVAVVMASVLLLRQVERRQGG